MIDYPEPEPYCDSMVVQVDPLQYLLVWFGAGIGYFILGGQCGFCLLKDRRNEEIVVAQSINS